MNCRACESDCLRLSSVPLVHLGDVVDATALLARPVAGFKGRTVESGFAVRDGVFENHVCGGTGRERQKGSSFGEHLAMWERVFEVG
jgi:hypothetical protein